MFRFSACVVCNGCSFKLTVTVDCGFEKICLNKLVRNCSETITGSTPLLSALFLKISAKKLDTTIWNPYPAIAQAACSRLEPATEVFPRY